MADGREHLSVPSWDGSARSWRRYTREVAWFVQSTPVHKRRYCASRLLSKLSGPARLLAMSWSKMAFDSVDGTKLFLQRLASSPLVRRSLPNAAAICQQYFSFRRNTSESIGNFLVRETLVHEEFVEALIRLHEEKLGISQEARDFGLPTESESEWDDGWQSWWRGDDGWYDDEYQGPDTHEHGPPGDSPHEERDPGAPQPDAGVPPGDVRPPQGATGSSPSHRPGDNRSQDGLRDDRPRILEAVQEASLDEMTLADSFILDVLRGWRLLQAAGLNAEEKRDTLSTTKNSLDYSVISSALQSLWDDQLLGHRGSSSSGGHYQAHLLQPVSEDHLYYHESDDWTWQDDSWWYEDHYHDIEDTDSWWWWNEDWDADSFPVTQQDPEDPGAAAKLQEAQQAERVAESLAAEAHRTWTEAQRATQALRKDRGFGAVLQPGGGAKCFNCGGNHFARDCPDRRHPSFGGKSKGKGKFRSYLADQDDYYMNYNAKGKSKGKSKKGMFLDAQAAWKGKGKGKLKGKDSHRSVNAYATDLVGNNIFIGGLEVSEVMGLSSSFDKEGSASVSGMLDSGATASAVVKGLIDAVLSRDPGARIDIQTYARPYFRFGNGKWGRSLGRTCVTSSVSGSPRQFSLYTLPNPTEYYSSNFGKASLVPILIGVDFLGDMGIGMVIDFATGLALNSKDPHPEIYRLDTNKKGHFVLDIVQYLTNGQYSASGQAKVVVSHTSPTTASTGEQQVLELKTAWFDMTACDADLDERQLQESRARIWQVYQASRTMSLSANLSAQMTSAVNSVVTPTTSSSRSLGDVAIPADARAGGDPPQHPVSNETTSQGGTLGHSSTSCCGPTRPKDEQLAVAMLRPPCPGTAPRESARGLASLSDMRGSLGVCPAEGQRSGSYQVREPRDDPAHAGAAAPNDGASAPNSSYCAGHAAESGSRREPSASDPGPDLLSRPRPLPREQPRLRQHRPQRRLRIRRRPELGHKLDKCSSGRRRGGAGGGVPRVRQPRSAVRAASVSQTPIALPLFMGKKVMAFATLMLTMATNVILGLTLDERDGLWEVACAPHSWLSEAAEQHHLRPRRINLANGYDLYRPETWVELGRLRRKHRPKRIWLSLPCTKWSPFTSLNFQTPEEKVALETARRRERRLLRFVVAFVKDTLDDDDAAQFYYEWPTPCFGWRQPPMLDLAEHLQQRGVPWLDCRVDGCNYGMKDSDGIGFIRKRWLIKTTDEKFHQTFRAKVCPGHHQHTTIEGKETARTSYYPWRMVQAIARRWRDQEVPQKHVHLLSRRDDSVILGDDPDEAPAPSLLAAEQDQFVEDDVVTEEQAALLHAPEASDDINAAEQAVEGPWTSFVELVNRSLKQRLFGFADCEKVLLAAYQAQVYHPTVHQRWQSQQPQVLLLGAFSRGAFSGISRRTYKYEALTRYLNGFLRHQLPGHSWSSLMLSFDSPAMPHRDCRNDKASSNILICFGSYTGGGLWLNEPGPAGEPLRRRKTPDGRLREGWVANTYHQAVTFSPRTWHASQSWSGFRIALSAFTTRLAGALPPGDRQQLRILDFPLINGQPNTNHLLPAEEITPPGAELPEGVTQEEVDRWTAQVAKYHRAAGHPANRNLARVVKDAGHADWKVNVVLRHACPACESLKPGGTSSGKVPPASTSPMYQAWQAVGVDSGEWVVPSQKRKVKFILFVDVATKLRVVHPLYMCDLLEMRTEKAQDVIQSLSERWLGNYPKPEYLLMDSAKTFISDALHDFASSVNIMIHYTAEKESWAHGIVEAAVQDLKTTASAIQLESRDQDPMITLQLATSALNATEYTAGYSAHQWAFGKTFSLSEEDLRTFHNIEPQVDYVKLVTARQDAELIAQRTRSKRVLTRLANSTVRQPIRNFSEFELVKIWRRVWPKEQFVGPRGGMRKSGRPHWVGPGRVIFSEVLPQQAEGDSRKHIVWVLIGNQLFRCSVHSVRPVTETEKFQHESTTTEDPSKWKSLADILPRKEYYDLTDQEPNEDEKEFPDLPPAPDSSTTTTPPTRRVRIKTSPTGPELHGDQASEGEGVPQPPDGRASSSKHPATVNDYDNPVNKKLKAEHLNWVELLEAEAHQESQEFNIFTAMDETKEFLRIELDIEGGMSNRQRKALERNPVLFLVKKMKDSEVVISKLSDSERKLFTHAKAKEVDSFIKNEAVRKCLSNEEVKTAYDSGRIVKARWVLTWKLIPSKEREEALQDKATNPKSVVDNRGARKAKARIVLLGFQHPNLLDPTFKTSSPVQSSLGRHLLYLMAAQKQWRLEGLDLATAFLQTQPTAADEQLWTSGVQELRDALGVGEEGIMRILRNIYGSTTAPRGLWLDLHKTFLKLGAQPVLGERCLWIWLSRHRLDGEHPLTIGSVGGHVDDFHRAGDDSDEWLDIKRGIDAAYKWGMIKTGAYRHAGTDVSTEKDERGFDKIVVDQSYYIEGISDVNIAPDRLRSDEALSGKDVEACRTTLGALQWIAIQTQPLLCARCYLLLTELVTSGTMATAREIQQLVSEARQEAFKLEFCKLHQATHWSQIIFVSMGDQAHANRPRGDSTGGFLTLAAGPECLSGQFCSMVLLSWRTWKLKRKAIGSNDAEVQSILEAEDHNFRTRLLWSELHGAGGRRDGHPQRADLVALMEAQVKRIRGVLCTDSRGGYDAVEVNESPLLGLSNMRAALQAFQLRDNIQRTGCTLRWVASDYDLADALTKKRAECRLGLLKYLRTKLWSIRYDPSFTSAKKAKKQGKSAIEAIDEFLQGDPWLSQSSLSLFGGGAACALTFSDSRQ